MTDEKNKRIAVIDYLRAFAITAVVVLHLPTVDFSPEINSFAYQIELFIKTTAGAIAIPLFILVSGISIAHKYNVFKINSFYLKRAKVIIGPYLFFSLFFLLYQYLNGDGTTLLKAISRIFDGSSFYHLWFMMLIPQYYLLYPLLLKIYQNFAERKKIWLVLTMTLLIQISWWVIMLSVTNNAHYNDANLLYSMVFLSNIFYFMFGMYVGKNLQQFLSHIEKKALSILAWLAFIFFAVLGTINHLNALISYNGNIPASRHIFDWIIGPVVVLSSFILFCKFGNIIEKVKIVNIKWFKKIGQYSFGIYLIHPFFIQVIKTRAYFHFGLVVPDIILFCLTMTASILVVYLLSLLPFGKYLVGAGHNKSGT